MHDFLTQVDQPVFSINKAMETIRSYSAEAIGKVFSKLEFLW